MKSHPQKSENRNNKISKKKLRETVKWINNLSPKLKDKFEMLARVQTAELLMREFQKKQFSKKIKDKKDNKNKKN